MMINNITRQSEPLGVKGLGAFYALTVIEIKPETADCQSVLLHIRAELCEQFAAIPGQYLTFRIEDKAGQIHMRSYSICEITEHGNLRIAVKRIEGGVFSDIYFPSIQEGTVLHAMPPRGQFIVDGKVLERKSGVVYFAAGSGITPIMSILGDCLENGNKRHTLFYQSRDRDNIIFKEKLLDLKSRFMDRFNLVFILSRETSNSPLDSGRIDLDKLQMIVSAFPEICSDALFLLCGPDDMTDLIANWLTTTLEFPKTAIIREMFVNEGQIKAKMRKNMTSVKEGHCQASVEINGVRSNYGLQFNRTILDSLQDLGVNVPFACKGGVCATCKIKLEKGEVDMPVNYALEEEEVKACYYLSCCSFPKSNSISLTYEV